MLSVAEFPLVLLTFVVIIEARIITECELAIAFKENLNEKNWDLLGDWMCVAITGTTQTNDLNTSILWSPPLYGGAKSYGIFQINNVQFCKDEDSHNFAVAGNNCNQTCTDFIDDDIADDIRCAQKALTAVSENFKLWNNWVTECEGKDLDRYRYLENCPATTSPIAPILLDGGSSNVTFIERTKNQVLNCTALGIPLPKVRWSYDKNKYPDLITSSTVDNNMIESRRIFPQISHIHSGGKFASVAKNLDIYGEVHQNFYVLVEHLEEEGAPPSPGLHLGLTIGIPLAIVCIAGVVIAYFVRKALIKMKNILTSEEIDEFLNGTPEKFQDETGGVGGAGVGAASAENAQYMPYDNAFNITYITEAELKYDRSKLLGEGQYGYVRKGHVKERAVAIKSVKPGTDKMYLKALLSELKIMVYLGKHPHIVSLLGAVTERLEKGSLLIVVELCELGDLLTYIRSHKMAFVAGEGGEGEEHQNVEHPSEYENVLMPNLNTELLVTWCRQIAVGMDYLGSKGVIHGDLAARNVLLYSNAEAKTTDFGLSLRLYDYTNYVKKQQAPLPWKWMAIESLRQMEFSPESDAWSFGVTMWEIFSLGAVRSWSVDFVHELESDLRLLKPTYATSKMYDWMVAFWNPKPSDRPTFGKFFDSTCDMTTTGIQNKGHM